MKDITFVKIIEVLGLLPMKNIVVNTVVDANKVYREFMKLAQTKYGYTFEQELNNLGLQSGIVFRDWINSEVIRERLSKDVIGNALLKRIKFAKSAELAHEYKAIYDKYVGYMTTEIDESEADQNTFVIRTNNGYGPVVFVTGMPDFGYEARHEVRRWYAWQYKINYFDVRECSYRFWSNHTDVQYATVK